MESEQTQMKPDLIRAVSRCWLSVKASGRKLLAELKHDLTFEQLIVLFILRDRDGQNLRDLSEAADRERTTMTRMVDGLEKRNLVVRVPDKTDMRNKLVYLTRQGRLMADGLDEHAEKFRKQAFEGLSEAEIADATRIIEKVVANLGCHD